MILQLATEVGMDFETFYAEYLKKKNCSAIEC